MMVSWWIEYRPHTIEQTAHLNLGRTTWRWYQTWDGQWCAFMWTIA